MEPPLLTTKNGFFFLLAFYLVKKEYEEEESTTKGRKNTRNYLEEKRRESKKKFLVFSSHIFKTQSKSISENLQNVPHGWRWRRAIREGAATAEERSAEREQQPGEKQPELLTLKLGSRFQT
jgi:hypothetical protein